MHTAHAFPDPDSVTIDMDSEGYVGVPSNFTWRSEEVGELHIGGNEGHFDFTLPGIAAVATFHDRVPWCEKRPDMGGPEVRTIERGRCEVTNMHRMLATE